MKVYIHENYRIQLKFWYLPLQAFHSEFLLYAARDGMPLNHNFHYFLLQKLKENKNS